MTESFEQMLSGGHHNSLGRTVEVTEIVLADKSRLDDIYQCYFSEDELVRLRVSSVFKRISIAEKEWLVPYIDRFLTEIAQIDQASTQWTLAILFGKLAKDFTPTQHAQAVAHLQHNLANHTDWIVLNYTMETLTEWSQADAELKAWLMPHLERISGDKRKAVKKRAEKCLGLLKGI